MRALLPLFLTATFCLMSCSQEETPLLPQPITPPVPVTVTPTPESSAIVIPDGDYRLKSLNSQPYRGPKVSITVTGNRISGKAPVNNINCSLVHGKVGPIASTMMAGDPAIMELEYQFLKFLEGSTLDITHDGDLAARKNGIAQLIFSKAPAME